MVRVRDLLIGNNAAAGNVDIFFYNLLMAVIKCTLEHSLQWYDQQK